MKKRTLGLWSSISIGVGGMMGAGIFSILGTASEISGNLVYVSFLIAGFIALLSAYSYAKLGVKFPSAGGPVEFLIRGFGDNIISGGLNILLWVGYVFALALYARAFGAYALTFFSGAPKIWMNIIATSIVILFTMVNFKGTKTVGNSELLIVSIKVAILIFFSFVGFFFIKPSLLSPQNFPHLSNVFFSAAIVFLAYEGFGLITNAAEDMKDPKKTLPRALYLSVLIVIAIYVGVSIVVVGNLPLPDIIKASDYALAAAAKPFLGIIGFRLMAIAALFSTSSAINATLFGGANVSYIIAKKGELPKIFERRIWKGGVEGLLITSLLVIIFANAIDLSGIAMVGSSIFLLIYMGVNIGHLKVYKETGANPKIIWLSILGCLFSFVILTYYIVIHSMITLIVLVTIFFLSFLAEYVYRGYTKRALKKRIFVR